MKLILVGRSGSGKTSVTESLLGKSPQSKSSTNTVTWEGSQLKIIESLGFFSESYDQQACIMKLAECVSTLNPGPDAFGLVIRIGRFTAEERKMIDIFRVTFGEMVFRFTILIFTRLDDLLYDDVSLDEFLADCTPELKDVMSLCGGRYIGFDNTGSWESRIGYGQSLVLLIKRLQIQNNNSVYTVDMLEKATELKIRREEKERKLKEESHRKLKEEMKTSLRQELQGEIRKDIEEKLSREEQECRMMDQTCLKKEPHTTKGYEQCMSRLIPDRIKDDESRRQLTYSRTRDHYELPDTNMTQTAYDSIGMILVGRSGSGKTSIIESLMGTTLPSNNWDHKVTLFGTQLNIAETFGFFSKNNDQDSCTRKLAKTVHSFHPGPDVFGLVIRIGRFTEEEKKMVDLFRITLGDDVFKFTILIFTRLDDLTCDNVSLEEFLKDSTPEVKELLSLCGKRYIGFDNTESWDARTRYSHSLMSMAKRLQMKNNGVYTGDMLAKATLKKRKKDEEEMKRKEESHRILKETMKTSIREKQEDQIKKDIEEKLDREERERKIMVPTSRQRGNHNTEQEQGRRMVMKPDYGQNLNTKDESGQQLALPHPIADDKVRRQVGYSTQKGHADAFNDDARQNPDRRAPSRKVVKRSKSSGHKPPVKPKPDRLKRQQSEELVWVCTKCDYSNDPSEMCCRKCGDPKIKAANSTENQEEKAEPRCLTCSGEKDSEHAPCAGCSAKQTKIARVPPQKPPRHGIDTKEVRIVLIGKTGAGKSSTANTLLDKKIFAARASMRSVTEKCQYHCSERWGRKIMMVDTPGLFDTDMSKDVISMEVKKSIAISAPGPHAFLLVASLSNRFTKEEQDVLKELDGMFGKHMMKYLIVVFTGRDHLEKDSDFDIVEDSPEALKQVLKSACGGYLTFNNRGKPEEKENDSKNLLVRIEKMVKENGGSHFTSEMFQEAEEVMQARIARELELKEQELRKEVEMELRAEMEQILKNEREYFQKLHESNVQHMEQMKLELKAEKEKTTNAFAAGLESEQVLEKLVHEEMERMAKKNSLILQIEKTEGAERVRMQHQLADVGEQIKQIVAKRKAAEEEVTDERWSTAVVLQSKILREEERKNVEQEEENALGRFTRGIKHIGASLMSLFR